MWRRNVMMGVWGLSLALTPIATAQVEVPSQSLVANKRWASLEIVFGRVSVIEPRFVQSRNASTGNVVDGQGETYSVSLRNGVPSLHYERLSAHQQLVVDIVDGNNMTILRAGDEESSLPTVEFSQPAIGHR